MANSNDITIAALIDAHKKDCVRRGNRAATLKDHEYGYKWLRFMGKLVSDIGRESFGRVSAAWLEREMSDSQVNRCISNMKLVTKWGADFSVNMLATDPLATLRKRPVGKREKGRTFTLEEARAIVRAAHGTPWYWPFVIYMTTGIRKMALMLREGQDWDSETCLLTVRLGEGNKVSHEDVIPLGSRASAELNSRELTTHGPLFPSTNSGFYASREPHRALQRACDRAGVPRGGCHAMRRCAATTIAHMEGSDMASLVLGHSDGKRTLAEARYITSTAEDARKAVQAMETALLEDSLCERCGYEKKNGCGGADESVTKCELFED